MNNSKSSNAALGGLKVIELGQLIAGPFAAKLLGEFGAEIIKIEPPDVGDPLRKWRKLESGTSLWWHVQSRNKKSVALDLKVPERMRLAHFLKHGREPNQWNEFLFEAYANYQFDAIFLTGLPDVPASLPHASKN